MSIEEEFENSKANYIQSVETYLNALKKMRLSDVSNINKKSQLASLRSAALASYEPVLRVFIEKSSFP